MSELIIRIPPTEIRIAYKEVNFKRLEEEVMWELKEKGKDVLVSAIKAIDDEEFRNHFLEMRSKGKEKKYIDTIFGELQYSRRRYKEGNKAGSRYLADEKLGIRKGSVVSPAKQMLESELAVAAGSYRAASEMINKYFFGGQSHESIRQVVVKEGQAIKRYEDAEISKIRRKSYKEKANGDGNNPGIIYVEIDGTGLKIQKSRKGKRGSRRNQEIKLGIGYKGHQDRYKTGNGKQKRLKEKFVYTGIEAAEEFMDKFSILCEKKLSLSKARMVIAGGDGAKWIKQGIKDYFYGARYVLCKFHLNRAIKRAFGYKKEIERKIKDYLRENKIEECIKKIDSIIKITSKKNKKRIKKMKELRGYIVNNRDGINGIEKIKEGLIKEEKELIRNTGAIEGNIDKVITHRMKKRGMSWSVTGAESILMVINKMKNGVWEDWWLHERDKKIEIKEEEYTRLIPAAIWGDREQDADYSCSAKLPALRGAHQDRIWVKVLRGLRDGQSVRDSGIDDVLEEE